MFTSKIELSPTVFKLTPSSSGAGRFTTRSTEERFLTAIEYRKEKLAFRFHRRQDTTGPLFKDIEKAEEELNIQREFFMKLAKEENKLLDLSQEGSGISIDAARAVQKTKHEITEALRYVFPNR